jgi:hypothetical protein
MFPVFCSWSKPLYVQDKTMLRKLSDKANHETKETLSEKKLSLNSSLAAESLDYIWLLKEMYVQDLQLSGPS